MQTRIKSGRTKKVRNPRSGVEKKKTLVLEPSSL